MNYINHRPAKFVTRLGRTVSKTNPWKATAWGFVYLTAYSCALVLIARLILGDK